MHDIVIDRDLETPIFEQLKQQIIRQIEGGALSPGSRLPATRDLADQLGVARISVVNAYEELKAEGYIQSHVGRGTFVTGRTPAAFFDAGSGALAGAGRTQGAALRELLRLSERPGVINFSVGTPADSFLPVDLIRNGMNAVLARDGASAIAYEQPEGYPPLRQAIAGLVAGRGIDVSADEVLITGGCQQALDLAIQALLNPGDVILTSNPTYAGILDIAYARGVNPIGVPLDGDGMQTGDLEEMIAEHRPRLIYLAPTYHNPTGTVMPLHRRRQLLDLAGRYRVPILEDGVYEDLSYTGAPPPPLKAMDDSGIVLYASSFSKVLLPGMRIGYLLAGERLYYRLARVKAAADICSPSLNQRVIHLALERGLLAEHVARILADCRLRRAAMLDALALHMPYACWIDPAGGLYLWLEMPPDGPASAEFYLHAVQMGVAFAPGPLFHTDGQGSHTLRLNMVAHPPQVIGEGIRRLALAWNELAAGYVGPVGSQPAPLL
jgi:DNA-binding transcriptional MocR family regulator